jgi:hypothetical protein
MIQRMWINQPSTLQLQHVLHGTNVLACEESPPSYMMRVYFLTGDVISMRVPRHTLSEGWIR